MIQPAPRTSEPAQRRLILTRMAGRRSATIRCRPVCSKILKAWQIGPRLQSKSRDEKPPQRNLRARANKPQKRGNSLSSLREFTGIEGADFFAEDRGIQVLLEDLVPPDERAPVF